MAFEDYTSRDWARHDEDEREYRESVADEVNKLQKELNVSHDELQELVWKKQMDVLRESPDIKEGTVEVLEKTKAKVKDFGTMMDLQDIWVNTGAKNVIDRKKHLEWVLQALKDEKAMRGDQKK